MKRLSKIALVTVLLIIFGINMAMASSGNAEVKMDLTSSVKNVKVGETFTVTLSQECKDGIQGIQTILSYDSKAFELSDTKYASNWLFVGEDNRIELITSNGEDIFSGEIVAFTFKALQDVESSKITLQNITAIKEEGDEVNIGDKSVEITVGQGQAQEKPAVTLSNISISATPKKTTYTAGEKFSSEGMKIMATYSDNSSKEITNYTYEPTGELSANNNTVTISYTENGVTKTVTQGITVNEKASTNNNNKENTTNTNNTNKENTTNTNNINKQNIAKDTNKNTTGGTNNTANNVTNTKATAADATTSKASNLPKTGNKTIVIAIVALAIVGLGFIFYKEYQKYKDI